MADHSQHRRALDIADCPLAVGLLARVRRGLEQRRTTGVSVPVPLRALSAQTRALVLEALGEGDIQAELDGSDAYPRALVRETAFAGVWHWQRLGATAEVLDEGLEVGDCAQLLRQRPFHGASTQCDVPREHDADTLGAVAVLAELAAKLDDWSRAGRGDTARADGRSGLGEPGTQCVSLDGIPLTPADHALLERVLGRGVARITSHAYGRCEIEATGVRPIWRVRQFNNAGHPLFASLEVAAVPTAVLATNEDLSESHQRLGELLVAISAEGAGRGTRAPLWPGVAPPGFVRSNRAVGDQSAARGD